MYSQYILRPKYVLIIIHIYYMYRMRSRLSNYLDRPNYTHCIKLYQVTGEHACFMLCILS